MPAPGVLFVADTEIYEWVDMFNRCHCKIAGSIVRTEWPDGTSYNNQPNIVVSMFVLIQEVLDVLKQVS